MPRRGFVMSTEDSPADSIMTETVRDLDRAIIRDMNIAMGHPDPTRPEEPARRLERDIVIGEVLEELLADGPNPMQRALEAVAEPNEELTVTAARVEAMFEALVQENPDDEDTRRRMNAFTRARMREDGFFRRIMPPVQISNDELDCLPDMVTPRVTVHQDFHPVPPQREWTVQQMAAALGVPRHVFEGEVPLIPHEHSEYATPYERAQWSIFVPKQRQFLNLHPNGTVCWGNSVRGIRFPDRESAANFCPDLIKAHNAIVVQVTESWWELDAHIVKDHSTDQTYHEDLRLVEIRNSHTVWCQPAWRQQDHVPFLRPMRLNEETVEPIMEMIKNKRAEVAGLFTHGNIAVLQPIPCHTIYYREAPPEVQRHDYERPLRSIVLDTERTR